MNVAQKRFYGMLYLVIGSLFMSFVTIGQWLYAERDDIVGQRNILIVEVNKSLGRDINPMSVIRPYYHFIPPVLAFFLFLLVCKVAQKSRGGILSSERIMPYAGTYLLGFVIYALTCIGFHLVTLSGAVNGLAYGKLPCVFHIILYVTVGFSVASDYWVYYESLWKEISASRDVKSIEVYRDYMLKLLKLLNRITIVLLITATLGGWKVLIGFSEMTHPIQSYHLITIIFDFAVCLVPMILWIVGPIFNLFQVCDRRYFDILQGKSDLVVICTDSRKATNIVRTCRRAWRKVVKKASWLLFLGASFF